MEGKIIIIEVDNDGTPIAPPGVQTIFVNQCGDIVRENIPINIKKWKITKKTDLLEDVVPNLEKNMCWEQMKLYFSFLEQKENELKDFAFKKLAIAFGTCKKNLYKNFIKKGIDPDLVNKYQTLAPY
jgi:hypothetical protein